MLLSLGEDLSNVVDSELGRLLVVLDRFGTNDLDNGCGEVVTRRLIFSSM